MSFLTSFWFLPQKEQERFPCVSSRRFSMFLCLLFVLLLDEDLVDHAVLFRLTRAHEEVALGVVLVLVDRVAGVLGQKLVHPIAGLQDLFGVDVDVGRLSLKAAER